jgi:transposase
MNVPLLEKHHMKFVTPLSQEEIKQLQALMKQSTIFRIHQRAHAILLSAKGYKINLLADIFAVDRDTISQWLTQWESAKIAGLADRDKPGRPPKLSPQEEEQAFKLILEVPQQVKTAIPKIYKQFGKEVSHDWIKRLLKKRPISGKESANPVAHSATVMILRRPSAKRSKS